jgi:hypothetical protein
MCYANEVCIFVEDSYAAMHSTTTTGQVSLPGTFSQEISCRLPVPGAYHYNYNYSYSYRDRIQPALTSYIAHCTASMTFEIRKSACVAMATED